MSTIASDCSKIYIHIPYIYLCMCFPNADPHMFHKEHAQCKWIYGTRGGLLSQREKAAPRGCVDACVLRDPQFLG